MALFNLSQAIQIAIIALITYFLLHGVFSGVNLALNRFRNYTNPSSEPTFASNPAFSFPPPRHSDTPDHKSQHFKFTPSSTHPQYAIVSLTETGYVKNHGFTDVMDPTVIVPGCTMLPFEDWVFWQSWCTKQKSTDPVQCWSIFLKVYVNVKDFDGTDCEREKDIHIMAQEAMIRVWSYPDFQALKMGTIRLPNLPVMYERITQCLRNKSWGNYVSTLTEKPRWFFNRLIKFYVSWAPYLIIFALFMVFYTMYIRDITVNELYDTYHRKLICDICGNSKPAPPLCRPVAYPTYNL